MEGRAANPGGSVMIDPNFNKEEYEVFAVPESQLESILSYPQSAIKDSTLSTYSGEARSATLHTESKSFDLTKVDTSNLFLFATQEGKNYMVHRMEHYLIDVVHSVPNKQQVMNILRSAAIYKDEETEYSANVDDERSKGISFKEIMAIAQTSEIELMGILEEEGAFQVGDRYFVFEAKDLLTRAKGLLLELHKFAGKIDFQGFEFADAQKILKKLSKNVATAVLSTIADMKTGEGEKWALSPNKLQQTCAQLLFCEKKSFLLKEFVPALKKMESLLIPADMLAALQKANEADSSWVAKNLYPGFAEKNLLFLQKRAYIGVLKKDAVIEQVDPYLLSGNVKKRFYQLADYKKGWTKVELQVWLGDLLPLGQGLDAFLAKNARVQTLPHPFNKSSITLYVPK